MRLIGDGAIGEVRRGNYSNEMKLSPAEPIESNQAKFKCCRMREAICQSRAVKLMDAASSGVESQAVVFSDGKKPILSSNRPICSGVSKFLSINMTKPKSKVMVIRQVKRIERVHVSTGISVRLSAQAVEAFWPFG